MKTLIVQALQLKKELTVIDYYGENQERQRLMKNLNDLLLLTLDEDHARAKTLQKNLLKHQQYILYFLYHPKSLPITMVPKEQ